MNRARAASRHQPDPVPALLQRAIGLHQTGDLAGAEALYARILSLQPGNLDALYLDGLAAHQRGEYPRALLRLDEARRISPAVPAIHTALGNAYRDQGDFEQAEACYRTALAADPGNADAHYNLGIAHHERGDPAGAIAAYRQAAAADPAHADAWNNLGVALKEAGHPGEAAECYLRATAARPRHAMAHFNLGVLRDAEGRFEDAVASYRQALEADPACAAAAYNLGVACKNLGRLEDAIAWFERTAALQPNHAGALQNLGATCHELGRLDEAERRYRQALAVQPDNAEVRYNLSLITLARGNFAEGWEEFEWRWQGAESSRRNRREFSRPQWRGEDIRGQTVLLHAEQGLGDTLQFCRYAPLVAARGARVVLECQPSLVRLLGSLAGVDRIVPAGQPLPAFDRHCPLMSLPRAFGTTLESIPSDMPYLHADPADVAAWRTRMAGAGDAPGALKVGLAWAGNPRQFSIDLNRTDRRRSIPFDLLAPLAECGPAVFYSLQLGEAAARAAGGRLPLIDLTGQIGDFADTAALVANLDLVISVDTSVAHLAGALGKPVWLLSRYDACWRWLRERDDSPWYPTLRLFRQAAPDDWPEAIGRLAAALSQRTGEYIQ